MKQVRYTQGRMAERSKAPDSRNSPLRLLVHECVPGFESHSCQILRSKSQHFGRSRSSESQIRSKTNGFHITRRCYRRQDEASAIYSRRYTQVRYTQEILLWDFWYTNVCVGSNPSPVNFCVQKGNILIEAVWNPTHVKFCVQKTNILVEAVFLRVKSRARRSRFHITRRCYRRQDEASGIYSRQDGRAV